MIVTVILGIGVVLLGVAAVLTLIRMIKGPSTLDRVIATDVLIAIVIASLATEAVIHRHATTLPVILVLSMLGFAGSLSIARFAADRDKSLRWNAKTSRDDWSNDANGQRGDPQ